MTDGRGDEKRERKKRMVRKKRNGAVLKRRKGRENIGEIDRERGRCLTFNYFQSAQFANCRGLFTGFTGDFIRF